MTLLSKTGELGRVSVRSWTLRIGRYRRGIRALCTLLPLRATDEREIELLSRGLLVARVSRRGPAVTRCFFRQADLFGNVVFGRIYLATSEEGSRNIRCVYIPRLTTNTDMSRRPFSIAELAARSRPTGYDPSKSLKDLLRIATAERNAGDNARAAGDVEAAFIHYAKASTLMLEELPGHPKFLELTQAQKDAVQVQGQIISDSLGHVKSIVTDRFTESRARHNETDFGLPVPVQTPTPTPPAPTTADARGKSAE
ncbi:hypothetical protein OPQ81_003691 [Rhizoctonia solani]|nr:hypothetical protein OPQ81_003691 [Rhizoctonia solani]